MSLKRIETLNMKFKEYHYILIDLLEDDEGRMEGEQAILDNYKDKTADIMEHIQQLHPRTKIASSPVHSTDYSHHLYK